MVDLASMKEETNGEHIKRIMGRTQGMLKSGMLSFLGNSSDIITGISNKVGTEFWKELIFLFLFEFGVYNIMLKHGQSSDFYFIPVFTKNTSSKSCPNIFFRVPVSN